MISLQALALSACIKAKIDLEKILPRAMIVNFRFKEVFYVLYTSHYRYTNIRIRDLQHILYVYLSGVNITHIRPATLSEVDEYNTVLRYELVQRKSQVDHLKNTLAPSDFDSFVKNNLVPVNLNLDNIEDGHTYLQEAQTIKRVFSHIKNYEKSNFFISVEKICLNLKYFFIFFKNRCMLMFSKKR